MAALVVSWSLLNTAACPAVSPDATVQVMRNWSGVACDPVTFVELFAAKEVVTEKSFVAETDTVGLIRIETGNLKIP